MAGGGLVPPNSGGAPSPPASPEIPINTTRALNAAIERFAKNLWDRSLTHVHRRGDTNTLVDTDVNDAYHELTAPSHVPTLARCLGDASLAIDGILVPFWNTSSLITFSGLALIGLGLYVREYHGKS